MIKKLSILLATALIIITMASACSKEKGIGASSDKSFMTISSEEAKRIMENEENYIILDVRTEEEYKKGHIPEAINIPNEEISIETTNNLTDKDQLILVYCRSGNRSKEASKKLVELGYTNVYDFGGINDWKYDIEQEPK
ncbi:MAG: rhodanese-like domain-containing protein [Clostridiaceae bacterium]